jgi:(1->4)-alpha-D-glucan 1-alpha-D-glucosylmutase
VPDEQVADERAASARALLDQVREELLAEAGTPLSTYRVQLSGAFTFHAAARVVPYLRRLGITHLYASPILQAAPGSTHGYDVVNHQAVNPELGGSRGLDALSDALQAAGLGLLLDVVPNHMGIEQGNALWMDVLENGPSSFHARSFDIDWDPVKEELKDKVLLPVLGDQYGQSLERGELRLIYERGAFFVRYHDRRFPLAPCQYSRVLGLGLEELARTLPPEDPALVELRSVLTAIEHLPRPTETDLARVLERKREKEVIKRRLHAIVEQSPAIAAHLEENLRTFNGDPADPRSFDRLDDLLDACSYRLAHWRVAGEEINYRRFFDVNGLAAIRVEDPEVFEQAHAVVFHLLAEGKVSGLRIDHPDGLLDPTAYFLDLQERYFLIRARRRCERDGLRWEELAGPLAALYREEVRAHEDHPLRRALYVVVEKIQGGKERIPSAWAVHGTVGYRFANVVTGLFVDRSAEAALTETYHRFIGREVDYPQLVYEAKRLVLTTSMSSEVNVLARELNRISELSRRTRDFTLDSLRRALVELISLFPVYRTYVDGWREVDTRDEQYVTWAIARARRHDPATNASLYDFLQDVLLRRSPAGTSAAEREVRLRFAMKVQQLTGPAMAKGLEDTAFYRYHRLTSLNEVGGEPERFGCTTATFHLRNQERAEQWPSSLLATSSHDTKRSEDVRARIDVLSEVPDEWRAAVRRWARLNARHKTAVRDRPAPDANDEYLYYQTLIGAWPMGDGLPDPSFQARMARYMEKAIKEAKLHTSWINPEQAYDAAVQRFVERTLDGAHSRAFLESARAFKRHIERTGQHNALGQVVLKLASPGVADFYQGGELWDLSLVDPDNRRPVDLAARLALLDRLDRQARRDPVRLCRSLARHMTDGRVKLYLTAQGLRLRRRRAGLFRQGDYRPLDVDGPLEQRLVAFARHHQGAWVVAAAPRLVHRLLARGRSLGEGYRGTAILLPRELGEVPLTSVFTGRKVRARKTKAAPALDAGELLREFPVVLLEGGPPPGAGPG